MSDSIDREPILSLRAGQSLGMRTRLNLLLRDLLPWIRRKAEWMVSRKRASLGASSLTQETALRFSRSIDAIRAKDEPEVKALLSRIMENTAFDSYRAQNRLKRDRKRQLLDEVQGDASPSAEESYALYEQHLRLQQAMESLPSRQQQALTLYLEERSLDEIATQLDCSVPAAQMLIQRAKTELKLVLSRDADSLGNDGR